VNENEIDQSAELWGIDQLIDQIITRDGAGSPRGGDDEALLTELSGLSPIEWPADEPGERIAIMVASRVGQRQLRQRRERGRPAAWTLRSR
jgi:hypothetical protein